MMMSGDCEDCKFWMCVNYRSGIGICTAHNEQTSATGTCSTFVRCN